MGVWCIVFSSVGLGLWGTAAQYGGSVLATAVMQYMRAVSLSACVVSGQACSSALHVAVLQQVLLLCLTI